MLLPVDFNYADFAILIAINGIGIGMFSAPNTSSMMSSVPADQSGRRLGHAGHVPELGNRPLHRRLLLAHDHRAGQQLAQVADDGLEGQGVPHAVAHHVANLPPVASLFAAVLGVNPLQHLLSMAAGALSSLPAGAQRVITGREFFPELISSPFEHGLTIVFSVSAGLAFISAIASWSRGRRPSAAPSTDGVPVESDEKAVTVGAGT